MLFNSIEFFLFVIPIFLIYWFPLSKSIKGQNLLLLIGSYFFYGWWDWRFLFLIAFSSVLDYLIGIKLENELKEKRRKIWLLVSVFVNLGLLGFFKYFNFFIESFSEAFTFFGYSIQADRLDIILPVGISFYTFQTMSYTLDIYRGRIKANHEIVSFMAFVSFFPQLVAGPIERASHLLPQFSKTRKFDYEWAISGAKIFVWGMFKKIVIADNAAILVEGIFSNYSEQTSMTLIMGSILFSFQIYGDFSGYSDMAVGLSRMLGFDLISNFKFPFLSRNISVFWKHWHISLSTWFRDYLYIPLGGNRLGKQRAMLNIFIVFLVSGFWHGANWTFIVWGIIHGLIYLFYILTGERKEDDTLSFSFSSMFNILITFILVSLAFIFFRSPSIHDSMGYLSGIFVGRGESSFLLGTSRQMIMTIISILGILILMAYEIVSKRKNLIEVKLSKYDLVFIGLSTLFLGAFKNHLDFVYFQF